jgi:hypothetical protein
LNPPYAIPIVKNLELEVAQKWLKRSILIEK